MASMIVGVVVAIVFLFFAAGVRIIRPTHRGLIERFGKYHRFAPPGFHWIIPGVDRMIRINTTEQMVDAQLLRKLEALEKSLGQNAKIVVPSGTELVNVIGEMAGVRPLVR